MALFVVLLQQQQLNKRKWMIFCGCGRVPRTKYWRWQSFGRVSHKDWSKLVNSILTTIPVGPARPYFLLFTSPILPSFPMGPTILPLVSWHADTFIFLLSFSSPHKQNQTPFLRAFSPFWNYPFTLLFFSHLPYNSSFQLLLFLLLPVYRILKLSSYEIMILVFLLWWDEYFCRGN